jgi:hypothetical protein
VLWNLERLELCGDPLEGAGNAFGSKSQVADPVWVRKHPMLDV